MGSGLSLFTIGAALQKALGSTPFSVVNTTQYSASYYIAFSYTALGVLLGLSSLAYVLYSSSLRFMGFIGAYLLAFGAISLINSPQDAWMQLATVMMFLGAALAALSAWLRHLRERS
ncbi:hypothetical protein SMALB_6089 [Streptomyces malaysiensis]|uniref:Uncharacterized protein n=1 Tax=Streptomyces malaysiensis TaxID=92644 RepID=A0A7X5X7E6_STRMQ|nr:hypothetical protein [Streptomyces malaysiensis]